MFINGFGNSNSRLMPEMPSAERCTMTSGTRSDFNISSREIESLVLEIKENLRLSTGSTTIPYQALPRSQCSRKSSRASPYSRPVICYKCGLYGPNCCLRSKRKQPEMTSNEDPYEFLQKLLKDGSLVNEAVKRVQRGFTPKEDFYYDSDDDCRSPIFRFIPKEN
ncbi:unnamed protein product [Phaedon cochleariae]|uniref:Uncharacterized protein n=1 Tax=Phaedon cochleariae TaxID=80249 RepID=A0A9P0DJZ8_PHACE|nr:unnamed protein product [Phaedon cochleariae]